MQQFTQEQLEAFAIGQDYADLKTARELFRKICSRAEDRGNFLLAEKVSQLLSDTSRTHRMLEKGFSNATI
jgi:hypothetical protein